MITFIGTHGTGKTTTAIALCKEDPSIHFQDGFSRPLHKIKKEGLVDEERMQYIINTLTLDRMKQSAFLSNKLILVRSIIDVLAYTVNMSVFKESQLLQKQVTYIKAQFKQFHNEVSFVYFPIQFSIEQDGVRPQSIEYQKKIDKTILELLEEFKIKPIVAKGNLKERVELIKSLVL